MTTYNITLNGQPYALVTTDAAQIAAIGLARARKNEGVADEDKIATDAAYLEFVFTNWVATNPGFTTDQLNAAFASAASSYAGQDIPPPADPAELSPEAQKAGLLAYAAAKRYAIETGGLVSQTFGALLTDRPTQSMLARAIQSIDLGIVSAPINFKGTSGFVQLDRNALLAIATVVAGHVQGAFDAEMGVCAGIVADAITTTDQIDAASWPSNS